MVPTDQNLPTKAQSKACAAWGKEVSAQIEQGDFDLVVLSNRRSVTSLGSTTPEESLADYQQGYEKLLTEWSEAEVPALVIRDTPASGDAGTHSIPDCVAQHPGDLAACSGPRADWEPDEPMVAAMKAVQPAGIELADFNDLICGRQTCQPVIGGVLVYYDGSHLTATYSRTLATPLAQRMHAATAAR